MLKTKANVAVFVTLLGVGSVAQAQSASDVIATVDGVEITLGQMIIARNQLPPQYQQLDDAVLFNGVLEQLIQQQVFANTFETDPARVTLALENERRALLAGEAINLINQEAVTEEALEQAYREVVLDQPPQEEFSASHILVATREEAQAVLDRLAGGEEFAALAVELSTDFGSGANGGDLGWFRRGMMVAPFEEAVLALEPGGVSDPVETQFGWHVVTLHETRELAPPAFEQIAGELETQLRQTAIEVQLVELTDAAAIDRADTSEIDPAVLRDLTLLEN